MRVVGIMLVRNEEYFVECALRNIVNFCDEIIVCDHQSKDSTLQILEKISKEFSRKIKIIGIRSPRESHTVIQSFAGTDTWIFAVDGDEVYDPLGLSRFRKRLEEGEFNKDWVVFGNVLNITRMDELTQTAWGYLAPPCRSMTKLFNFSAIDSWEGDVPERLHGGKINFRSGYHLGLRNESFKEIDWDDADFRCLHLCFILRSSIDKEGVVRPNIMDRHAWSIKKIFREIVSLILRRPPVRWKEEKYARGSLVKKDIQSFSLRKGEPL